MVWTRRSIGVNLLIALEDQRRDAGRRLAALRESRGLTQEELAHRAGISTKTVSRFENGRHDGRRQTVRSIAGALEVEEAAILGPPRAPLGLDAGPSQLDQIQQTLRELGESVQKLAADNARLKRMLKELADTRRPPAQRKEGGR